MESPSAEVPDCSTSQMEEHMAEETDPVSTVIMDLPDEILENIFARVSTYDDLDNVRLTCKRFYFVYKSKFSST